MPLKSVVICPVGLMDKTMDSGSINVGSIPARDTSMEYRLDDSLCFLVFGGFT